MSSYTKSKSLVSDDLIKNFFINDNDIKEKILYAGKNKNNKEILNKILECAKEVKGICPEDALTLLLCNDEEINRKIFSLAKDIKLKIYGKRVVLFAPIYLSNYCINGCSYCSYHVKNKNIIRKMLSQEEIKEEVIALQKLGHKRLAIETGEDERYANIDYIIESINTIYNTFYDNGAIRRVNINIAATSLDNYKKLKNASIGTYVLFQETYHKDTYEALHTSGPKSDYYYHSYAMNRAMEAGIDDVGIGVLFGLYDYKYDFLSLLTHANHLESKFNCGPHTISVPRIKPADDVDLTTFYNTIDDNVFKKIVAVIRIALPYTGIIVSTRENKNIREHVLGLGVSQISGGSKTSVGGYTKDEEENSKQFEIDDKRPLDDIIYWLCSIGYMPSFCTSCYREGRVGEDFMAFAKSGDIKDFCQVNSIITLKEYSLDYASGKTSLKAEAIIKQELEKVENEKLKNMLTQEIKNIELGKRDFKF